MDVIILEEKRPCSVKSFLRIFFNSLTKKKKITDKMLTFVQTDLRDLPGFFFGLKGIYLNLSSISSSNVRNSPAGFFSD